MNISKSVTWHSSVIDNAGKTTKEYRHRTRPTDTMIQTRPTDTMIQDIQQLIAMQNQIHEQNNPHLNTLNNKNEK